jgi:2,3-bisphosphoglycerate-dependent phosphoglycerate mutase
MDAPPHAREVLVLRHGESEWNAAGRWQGWLDIALTERGIAQARARGESLAAAGERFAAIYCSDLGRARRTAEVIADTIDGPSPVADPGFRERHGGVFQGRDRAELESAYGDAFAAWRAGTLDGPPDGETAAEVLERFGHALAGAHHATPPGALLVVTHGGVMRLVAQRAGLDASGVLDNCAGLWFSYVDGALRPSRRHPAGARLAAPGTVE